MPSFPISRPGPIAFAAVAALTIGVMLTTAAVPADTGPLPFVGAVHQLKQEAAARIASP